MIQVYDSLSLELLSQASIELTDHSKKLASAFSPEDDIKVELLFHRQNKSGGKSINVLQVVIAVDFKTKQSF